MSHMKKTETWLMPLLMGGGVTGGGVSVMEDQKREVVCRLDRRHEQGLKDLRDPSEFVVRARWINRKAEEVPRITWKERTSRAGRTRQGHGTQGKMLTAWRVADHSSGEETQMGDGALVLEEEYVGFHLKRWIPVKWGKNKNGWSTHREGLSRPNLPEPWLKSRDKQVKGLNLAHDFRGSGPCHAWPPLQAWDGAGGRKCCSFIVGLKQNIGDDDVARKSSHPRHSSRPLNYFRGPTFKTFWHPQQLETTFQHEGLFYSQ